MQHFPFSERKNLLVFCCTHVLDGEEDISFVTHHFDDCNWQFLCGRSHRDEDAVIISIGELLETDKTIGELCDLPVGFYAKRAAKNSEWESDRISGEQCYKASVK